MNPGKTTASDKAVESPKEVAPWTVRSMARAQILNAWSFLGWAGGATRRGLRRPRVHFLCLHDLFPAEEPGFRKLLQSLAVGHEFVTYSEGVRRILQGKFTKPAVAFSFDDGFQSVLRGARILEEFGARACFFLCPPILGETRPGEAARFCRERLMTRTRHFIGWKDCERLLAAGHEIGGHTMTHPRLSLSSRSEMEDEIGRCRLELIAKFGVASHFAWPFGHFRDVQAGVGKAVFGAGFESCASAERGCHVVGAADPAALCLRRENVVAAWPGAHVRFFLGRSARKAGPADNAFPEAVR